MTTALTSNTAPTVPKAGYKVCETVSHIDAE